MAATKTTHPTKRTCQCGCGARLPSRHGNGVVHFKQGHYGKWLRQQHQKQEAPQC